MVAGVGEEGEELGVGAEQRSRLQRWQGTAGAAAHVEVLVETPLAPLILHSLS